MAPSRLDALKKGDTLDLPARQPSFPDGSIVRLFVER